MEEHQKPRMVQLYLPNSTKFSNTLLIKRLGTATPHTISFDTKDTPRCHNMKYNAKQHNSKPLIILESTKPISFTERNIEAKDTHKRRLSFSRMVQESSRMNDFDFSRISHFYKKSIEREIAAKKEKKDNTFFSKVLNVIDYNPQQTNINRFRRTPKTTEKWRCQKPSHSLDHRKVKSSLSPRNNVQNSMRSRELRTRDSRQQHRYHASEERGRRRAINLNVPEHWNVDSWSHARTKVSDKDAFEKQEI